MCMHSQATDYTTVCLDVERGTGMLLGASADRAGGEWVSAHSLEVETLLVRGAGASPGRTERAGSGSMLLCAGQGRRRPPQLPPIWLLPSHRHPRGAAPCRTTRPAVSRARTA